VRRGPNRIGFEVGAYDATRPLVIDPVLSYAAYFGGSGFDVGRDIAVDPDGRTYLTGATDSEDFPIKNPLQSLFDGDSNAFVARISPPH
jgi:hypothetical protein